MVIQSTEVDYTITSDLKVSREKLKCMPRWEGHRSQCIVSWTSARATTKIELPRTSILEESLGAR